MSPGNQGVFQLLDEVAFRRVLVFYNSQKWERFTQDTDPKKIHLLHILIILFPPRWNSYGTFRISTVKPAWCSSEQIVGI